MTLFSSGVDALYRIFFRLHLCLYGEKSALSTFLFHGLFNNKSEIEKGVVDPQQKITLAHFREFIEHYLRHGYIFVSPTDVLNGLEPGKKYALITFDDGYYNNLLALPILEEFNVPATFFISINHVLENKCFWWDTLYRERTKNGECGQALQKEYAFLKEKKNSEIEDYLINTFGRHALTPIGDIDRPFTPEELKKFSSHPLVHIGNHTFNHAILTNYSREEMKIEIVEAQRHLEKITGRVPSIIAYPNGNYSFEVISVSREAGLKMGITVKPGKNYLPLDKDSNLFELDRFTLWGNAQIQRQCEFSRTEIEWKRIKTRFVRRNKVLWERA